MIDKFCDYLTNKIRKEMPDVDDERAEVIKYGLQLIIGEIPKFFIMAGIALAFGILEWTVICFILMLPYRMYSGGFHLKTHIGCIIGTSLMYTGNVFISQFFVIPFIYRIIIGILLWIFSILMIKLYAPADTESVPVVSKKERKKRKIISYIIVTIMVIVGIVIKNDYISNILLIGVLLQTFSI
ncbi:MAG: accessory gene regulator B family protein, partial [Clostridia bacterium]|nr:accessory gene regulator B family protein [Clostridia bacterium]